MPTNLLIAVGLLLSGGFGLILAQATAGDSNGSSAVVNALTVIGAGAGAGGIGMALQALGNNILKPILDDRRERRKMEFEARRTDEKLAEAQAAFEANRKRIEETEAETQRVRADYTARLAELEAKFDDKEKGERKLIDQLTELTARNASETQKNIELAYLLLEREGRVKQVEGVAGAMVISDRPPPQRGIKVLVVEDNPAASRPLRIMMEWVGCTVEVVDTLADGLSALVHGPDVILLDLMLPDGDGIEILRRVKDARLPIRVIVTTGKDEALLGPVRALGPEAVLHKPFVFETDLVPLLRLPAKEVVP